ncbi:MAG: STAS domain-containing protein [bacterium]|nr:STAS domain-containing protein [bacterium]
MIKVELIDTEEERIFVLDESKIDPAKIKHLEKDLHSFILEDDRDAIIDMSNVSKIDISILPLLVRAQNKLMLYNRSLYLVNTKNRIQTLIKNSGLDSLLLSV